MKESIETRIGYKTINILKDELEEYIRAFTRNDGIYEGNVYFLYLFSKFDLYLNFKCSSDLPSF